VKKELCLVSPSPLDATRPFIHEPVVVDIHNLRPNKDERSHLKDRISLYIFKPTLWQEDRRLWDHGITVQGKTNARDLRAERYGHNLVPDDIPNQPHELSDPRAGEHRPKIINTAREGVPHQKRLTLYRVVLRKGFDVLALTKECRNNLRMKRIDHRSVLTPIGLLV
jgi:hypothetical protein